LKDSKDSSVYGYQLDNYIRELIGQKLDGNGTHFLYARRFCSRPNSKVSASEQSRCSASVNVLCWCISEVCKYGTSAIVMVAAMTSYSSVTLGIERFASAL